ncbi:MAG: gliding motility-associated C-terminal domain-containing protein [Bacteroidales bacterium]|nr:gliding motility-associated C-terminal domain-containing protein [Bacteroidales bacterium]
MANWSRCESEDVFIFVKILFLFLLFFIFISGFSQLRIGFERYYADDDWDFGRGVIELSSGNFIILDENGAAPEDLRFTKTDQYGNIIWTKGHAVSQGPYVRRNITPDGDAHFLLKVQLMGDDNRAYYAKLDTSANIVWEKEIDDALLAIRPADIKKSNDGNYFLAYTSFSRTNDVNYFPSLMKLDVDGNGLWKKDYIPVNVPGIFIYDFIEDADGNIYMTGYSGNVFDFDDTYHKLVLIKTDANGNELFRKIYDTRPTNETGRRINKFMEGEFTIWSSSGNNIEALIVNSSGVIIKKIYIVPPKKEEDWDLVFREAFLTDDDQIALFTVTNGYHTIGTTRYGVHCNYVVLLDHAYNKIQDLLTESSYTNPYVYDAMIQTNDGGYAFVGYYRDRNLPGNYDRAFSRCWPNFCFKMGKLDILASQDTICPGESVEFTASGGDNLITWSDGSTTDKISVTEGGEYFYSANILDCGTLYSDTIEIVEILPPDIELMENNIICEGDSVLLKVNNGDEISWNNGLTGSEVYIDTSGDYFATVQNICGEYTTDNIEIELIPDIYVDIGNDTTVYIGQTILLDAYKPDVSYLWNTGSSQPDILVTDEGLYVVGVTNYCGTIYDSVYIDYLDLPELNITNIITPNGDEYNDYWTIYNAELYNQIFIKVWDNAGRLVFNADSYQEQWNGYYNGSPLPSGSYYYIIEDIYTNRKYTGNLVIYHK